MSLDLDPRTVCVSARAAYDQAASLFDSWHWQEFWQANEGPVVAQMLDRVPTGNAGLDVGCGTGGYLRRLIERGYSSAGLDVSMGMLQVARAKVENARLVCGDAQLLPFPPGAFGLVLCVRVFSHVRRPLEAFEELNRVLDAEGYVLLSEIDAGHEYRATRLPTGDGSVLAETYKWSIAHLLKLANQAADLSPVSHHVIHPRNLRWRPRSGRFRSIDFESSRAIANVVLLRRGA